MLTNLCLFTLFLFFQIYPDMKASARKRKTLIEWIRKYLLEGKFTGLCISYTQPTQDLEITIQLFFSVFADELGLNWQNYALSFRAGFDSHSNPGPWSALRRCSMVRKANCETPPSGGRGHSFYVLPSDLVELCGQVQLLETVSWQIFHVHNNDIWFHDCR